MSTQSRPSLSRPLLAGSLAVAAVIMLATVLAWFRFGSEILLNAASAGLSWCF